MAFQANLFALATWRRRGFTLSLALTGVIPRIPFY